MAYLVALFLLICPLIASAHPGPLDACGGHVAEERVEYPNNPNGQPSYPSEPGEFHFHLDRAQFEEAKQSLAEYRATHPMHTWKGIDYGSFTVGNVIYDIIEKTRQDEAILHCVGDDAVTHTGIARGSTE